LLAENVQTLSATIAEECMTIPAPPPRPDPDPPPRPDPTPAGPEETPVRIIDPPPSLPSPGYPIKDPPPS